MEVWQSSMRDGNVHHLLIAVAGYCCTCGVLLCMRGADVCTCSAICVHGLCCLDVSLELTKSAHLLRDVQIRAEPRCVVIDRSFVSCFSCFWFASLPHPWLPRTDVIGWGVAVGVGMEGVVVGG